MVRFVDDVADLSQPQFRSTVSYTRIILYTVQQAGAGMAFTS